MIPHLARPASVRGSGSSAKDPAGSKDPASGLGPSGSQGSSVLGIGVVAVLGMARAMARAGFDCSSGGAGPESSPRPWAPPASLSNVNQGDIPGY